MELNVVAQRYASALAELSKDDIEKVNADLAFLQKALRASASIRVFFEAPGIASHVKKEKAEKAFRTKIDDRVLNLFLLLIDRGRVAVLSELQETFQSICDNALGHVQVKVALARRFSDKEEIEKTIAKTIDAQRKKFGLEKIQAQKLEYIIHEQTDASLIGGITLRVGDYLLDASVKEYLKKWRYNVKMAKPSKSAAWS